MRGGTNEDQIKPTRAIAPPAVVALCLVSPSLSRRIEYKRYFSSFAMATRADNENHDFEKENVEDNMGEQMQHRSATYS